MSNEQKDLSAADFAAILSTTLAMANEAGLTVGVRQSEATGTRPAGLLVFVAGLSLDAEGRLIALESVAPFAKEPAP